MNQRSLLNWCNKSTIPLLLISLILNLGLAARLLENRQLLKIARESGNLKPGASVSALELSTPDGTPIQIRYDDQHLPTVLYVLSPRCKWCARNTPNLKAILSAAGKTYRAFVISLVEEDLKDYRAEYGIAEPILVGVSKEAIDEYHMGGTPQTLVVSPDGMVTDVWMGAYIDTQKRAEIESVLGVTLPPLSDLDTGQASDSVGRE
jgi:hypothetical protein